jgi:hypothetical protein
MSSSIILLFAAIAILYMYFISEAKRKINKYNKKILEQKEEIIKINNICERLLLTTINNDNLNINSYYINFIIFIALKSLLLITVIIYLNFYISNNYKEKLVIDSIIFSLIIIILISFIIVLIIYNCLFKNYINVNIKEIRNIEEELNNKKIEINNFNKNKLLSIIDSNISILNINYSIDEYISNYQSINIYLSDIKSNVWLNKSYSDLNIKKNKRIVIFELRDEMIKNKEKKLIAIMKTELKTNNLITSEIINKNLEDYKKILEIKINEVINNIN